MELQNTVEQPPFYFKIAKWLQKNNIRGGYRLENIFRSLGLLDVNVIYSLGNSVSIKIPISILSYDLHFINSYEHKSIEYLKIIISSYNCKTLLVDCGADIGLISAKLVAASDKIDYVYSFEPNIKSYKILEENQKLLPVKSKAINKAVADFAGKAILMNPSFDSSDHAAFIVPDQNGVINVMSIDDVKLPVYSCILIKVDVEGGELDVLHGASKTILTVKHFIIIFEAHYKQAKRAGLDPVDVIAYIKKLRPSRAVVVERTHDEIDLKRPFFDQFPEGIYNICVHSE